MSSSLPSTRAWRWALVFTAGCGTTVDPGDAAPPPDLRVDAAADGSAPTDRTELDASDDVRGALDAPMSGDVSATVDAAADVTRPPPGTECDGTSIARCPRTSLAVVTCEDGYCVGRRGAIELRSCNTGSIVDVSSSPLHCGRCDHACPRSARCVAGACVDCGTGAARCGTSNTCDANLLTSTTNCGACGQSCGAEELCSAGVCTPCPAGRARCGVATCYHDLSTSPFACGACGHRCADAESCVAGVCAPCPAGQARCGGLACRDLQSDRGNCGACGRECADGAPCESGACVACPAGMGRCGDAACRDLSSDAANCGACGNVCAALSARSTGSACVAGRCASVGCVPGTAECDGSTATVCETELDLSAAHCGACGHACEAGERCIAGRCTQLAIVQRAPTSATSVTSNRPTLWWTLSRGVTGARVQLCAARDCATVRAQWDVTGDHWRVPEPLDPTVHYWQLFARRDDAVDPSPGLVWEFLVPSTPSTIDGYGPPNAVGDLNGDGLGDLYTPSVGASYGTASGYIPPAGLFGPPPYYPTVDHVWGTGDLNGDGRGDLFMRREVTSFLPQSFAGPIIDGRSEATLYDTERGLDWTWGDYHGDGSTEIATVQGTSLIPFALSQGARSWRDGRCVRITPSTTPRMQSADWNGDGYDDLRVRPYTFSGFAYEYLGSEEGLVDAPCAP